MDTAGNRDAPGEPQLKRSRNHHDCPVTGDGPAAGAASGSNPSRTMDQLVQNVPSVTWPAEKPLRGVTDNGTHGPTH